MPSATRWCAPWSGRLVDVGRGKKRASDMLWILRAADRQQASQPAPPHGLCLVAVRYGS